MSKRTYLVETKDRSDWWAVLVAAALFVFWKYILIAIAIAVAIAIIYIGHEYDRRRKIKAVPYEEEMPTTLTTEGMRVWGNPEHYLDDYDDGLRDWA
jgi:hypothetical protein